jgi:membrane-bound ClpP family serine protease
MELLSQLSVHTPLMLIAGMFGGLSVLSVILLVVGLSFLLIEMFVPGFGFFGITGIICLVVDIFITANTFQEAQQMSALIILPVILLFIGQTTGLFLLNNWILLGFGAAIYIIDFLIVRSAAAKFVPEKLL